MDTVKAIAEHACESVTQAIIRGSREDAREAINVAFDTVASLRRLPVTTPVARVINAKVAAILAAGGVHTIDDLCEHSRDTLKDSLQLRYRSVDLIERALAKHGFRLRR